MQLYPVSRVSRTCHQIGRGFDTVAEFLMPTLTDIIVGGNPPGARKMLRYIGYQNPRHGSHKNPKYLSIEKDHPFLSQPDIHTVLLIRKRNLDESKIYSGEAENTILASRSKILENCGNYCLMCISRGQLDLYNVLNGFTI